ncbi:MAG: hypothetical protein A3K09_01295 [Nitrospinae bacterium RIFCSPLOWO2_12_FULL_47_7]|nr:MAG: hypothetical protein A3K09_01295 [Nitrospinae bacterium RIFCSPLOWO2_12_FULL_47_7]
MGSSRKCFLFLIITLLSFFGQSASVRADAPPAEAASAAAKPDPDDINFFKDIEVHGFVSSSYFNHLNADPSDTVSRRTNFRAFDFSHNSFKFDVGILSLKKDAAKPGDIGFRTDIAYGFSVPQISKSAPGLVTTTGAQITSDNFDVIQGYVSYNAPIGNGLRMDLGKFVTNIGVEVIPGPDGWNNHYSSSWLFTYGPYTHSGLRGVYTFNEKISVLGMVANGWDNTVDTNNGKTLSTGITYTPLSNVSLTFNWMGGPEPQVNNPSNERNSRNLFDFIGTIGLTDKLRLTINADSGRDANNSAITPGQNADWWMFVGYLRYDANKWFSMNFRGETFDDTDGYRTGIRQHLWEVTFTPEFRVNKHFVLRPEFRHDKSNVMAFGGPAQMKDTQDTFAVNALFFF